MTWQEVDDILYDGTLDEVKSLRCPDCGSEIFYSFTKETRTFKRGCNKCGILIQGNGGEIPNCAVDLER